MRSMESLNYENTSDYENIEKPKWHYVYYNNELADHPVVFECDAEEIAVADALYQEKMGKKPERQNHIGCSIIKN